jgi:hypothetical protein
MGQAIFGANVTVSEETIAASTIHIYLDMTNQQVGYSLQLSLASAYRAFTESLLASCNIGEAAELNAEVFLQTGCHMVCLSSNPLATRGKPTFFLQASCKCLAPRVRFPLFYFNLFVYLLLLFRSAYTLPLPQQ